MFSYRVTIEGVSLKEIAPNLRRIVVTLFKPNNQQLNQILEKVKFFTKPKKTKQNTFKYF